MKTIKRIQYLLLGALVMLSAACKEEEPLVIAPTAITGEASDIYRLGATLSGSIQNPNNASVKEVGIQFSELQSMAEYDELSAGAVGGSAFSVSVSSLSPGQTYYYRAYASSGASMVKGEVKSFTTTQSNAPVFNELTLWSKDKNSCKVSVEVIDDGGSNVNMSGFVWKESGFGDPTIYDNSVNVSMQGNSLATTITGLEPNKTYVVRAYAQNAVGVSYSNSVIVPTSEATVPYLSNVTRIDSTTTSVTVKAHIIDAGSSAVTKIGFCYSSDSSEPTTNHSIIDLTEQIEEPEFWASIGDLETGTTYYIRAFAENEDGAGYSDVLVYTPKKEVFGAVDLGLSVLWANFNLGATSSEEYGDYYAFGEISPKDTYTEENWIKPGTLYLPAEKDAATQQLGEDWRMPTEEEVTELLTECSWELITLGEQCAYKVIGKNGNFIILPLTGSWNEDPAERFENYEARYRTSEAFLENSSETVDNPSTIVLELQKNFADTEVDYAAGWKGHPIRAVKGERKQEEPSGDVTEKVITQTEAGTLADFITEAEQPTIGKLTVSGPINGDDLYLINNMARENSLTDLNLSNARIVEGGGTYESHYYTYNDDMIGDEMLVDTKLKKILLPTDLKAIGNFAFAHSRSLAEIIIPDAVTIIGGHAFEACVSLSNATIGKHVAEIGERAFSDCSSLSEVTCSAETPPNISGYAFQGIAYPATLYVPAGCYGTYRDSRWAELFPTITDGVFNSEVVVTLTEAGTLAKYITDENKYYITKLKVTGPLNGDDIRLIREMAADKSYIGKSLKYLDLSEARIVSGGSAYYTEDSYSYNTYDNEIGENMFLQCRGLETILLPKDIEWIGKSAFAACQALKSIDLPNGITSIEPGTFSSCSSLTHITLPEGVTSIKDHAFMACSSLAEIYIPNGVTSIGENAFDGCTSLTTIKVPDGVTSIAWECFARCSALKSIDIPNSVSSIEPYAFQNCSALESVTIGSGLESISYRVFRNCTSLKSINIPDGVRDLGDESFMGCTSLENATLGSGLMGISDGLFNGCSALKEVTINNESVLSIGSQAFYKCASLTSINIPASVESIDSEAFSHCRTLAEMTCGATTPPTLGTDVFTRIASPATLIVPAGSSASYSESDWSSYFTTIEEM